MSEARPLTEEEVRAFAVGWYKMLDDHAPVEEYRPLLAPEGLEMCFPECAVHGWEGFHWWYERVSDIFFDETHTLKTLEVDSSIPGQSRVKLLVNWQASVWRPPTARSRRIVLDAAQSWILKRSPTTSKPMIAFYVVEALNFAPESARL